VKIGRHVRKAREAIELKQQELADEVEVTSQHVSRIELDLASPSIQTLLKLSQKLGVSTDYLLTGHETAPPEVTGAIRADPDLSAAVKRHLIGLLDQLRARQVADRSED
jgi:transcriptional regulator with XRE-family HTH domain